MDQPNPADAREEQVHGSSGPGGPLRRLKDEWDFWLIWACVASIALAVSGAISATIEAFQRAAAYH